MTATINASTSAGVVTTADTSGILQLQTNGTAALTVDASQNVGVGTASPGARLDVQGTADTQIRAKGTSGIAAGTFRADGFTGGSYPGFQLAQSGTHYWTMGQRADTNLHLYRESGSGNVVVDSGTLQTPSTISVGNATPSASGAGITFPATQSASSDANTLDDYEEGTWTPTLTSFGGTGLAATGYYTRIGRIVNWTVDITGTSVTSTANTSSFTMPFTAPSVILMGTCVAASSSTISYGVGVAGSTSSMQTPTWTATSRIFVTGVMTAST